MFDDYKAKASVKLHPEIINRHDKVERYGYVPIAKRIRAMLEAGENLAAIRTEMCDFPSDAAIDWSKSADPILSRDFDKFQEAETIKLMREKYDKLIATQKKLGMIKELVDEGIISLPQAEQEKKEVISEEEKTTTE